MVSLVFGAGIYECLVVHPAWSRKPPESLVGFVGSLFLRCAPSLLWRGRWPTFARRFIAFFKTEAETLQAGRLQSEARRWVRLNWIRVALVAISWWGALTALATRV
jgi:hypothetical protein